MKKSNGIIKLGLAGSVLSFIILIVIPVIYLNAGSSDYLELVRQSLANSSSAALQKTHDNAGLFSTALAVDTLFITAEIPVWLGLFFLLREKNRVNSYIVLVCGLSGAFLDYVQNVVEFTVIRRAGPGAVFSPVLSTVWHAVTIPSYMLAFAAGIVLILSFLNRNAKTIVITASALVFTAGAIAGVFADALYPVSFLWYVIFFAVSGIVLFKRLRNDDSA